MSPVFTRLLLATEHSEYDSGAEALAFALAARDALPLAGVLPMVSNPEFEMVAPQLAVKADAEASAKRQSLLSQAGRQGVALDLQLRRGPEPYLEIVEEAHLRGADLIVIRRRGRPGLLANLLVGEMVSKVVAHAPCSLLIAPRGARPWQRQVLLGIDPLAPDAGLLAQASALAAAGGLPLRLLSVAASAADRPSAEEALAEALPRARAGCPQVEAELRVGRPHLELIAAAQACGADLIVVGRHGDDALARAWIGGTAQKVIGLADCPVLVHVSSQPKVANP